jgi:MoaA/NifB/PqqE/SkfB family radical SAM enzyme
MTVLTSTNAQELDERSLDRFQTAGFKSLQVSMDGIQAPTHDALRGPGTFARAMRAVRMVADRGLLVVLAVALHRRLLAELDELLRFVEEQRLYSLKLQPVIEPFHYADGLRGDVGRAEARRVVRRAGDALRGSGIKLSCPWWVVGRGRGATNCAGDLRTAIVQPDGRVSTCENLPGLGNAYAESFLDAWGRAADQSRSLARCGCFAFEEKHHRLEVA